MTENKPLDDSTKTKRSPKAKSKGVMPKDAVASVDGRRSRGERTRNRILRVTRNRLKRNTAPPTAQEIALLADVALRTMYHHFVDIDALFFAACDLTMINGRPVPAMDYVITYGAKGKKTYQLIPRS